MCIPLANEGVGLGPSSGPVASRPYLGMVCFGGLAVILFTWVFHALVFHAWGLACSSSGSRTSRYGLLVYVQGASDSLPHSSPGRKVVASVFGVAVRALLQATCSRRRPFLLAWMSPWRRVRVCPSLPFKDCNSVLKVLVLKCRVLTFS